MRKEAMKKKGQFLALAATAALIGCGGSGGGGLVDSSNLPSGIYIGDYANHRVVRISDMQGSGWMAAPDFYHVAGIAFDGQGKLMATGSEGGSAIIRIEDMASKGRVALNGSDIGSTSFGNLKGVLVDSQNRILIVDTDGVKKRILRIDNWSDTTADILDLTQYFGSDSDQVRAALDSQDQIYCVFRNTNKILKFDNFEDATPDTAGSAGSAGSGTMQFNQPVDVAIDSQGRIYVADWAQSRIVRFDDFSGANWTTFGTSGSGEGQFGNPSAIALDSAGRIYVADSSQDRVVRIDDMSGTGWVAYGVAGSGDGQFNAPWEIAIKE